MLLRLEAWAKANRLALGCSLAGLLLGLALGRFGTPTKVRVETKTVEVEKVKTVEVVKEVRVEARAQQQQLAYHVVYTRSVLPGGEVQEKAVVDAHRESLSHTVKDDARIEEKVQTVEVVRTVERGVEKEAARARFQVAALAGFTLQAGLSPVYGASVEYRVAGPVWVGVWGLSSPAAGVSLGLQW